MGGLGRQKLARMGLQKSTSRALGFLLGGMIVMATAASGASKMAPVGVISSPSTADVSEIKKLLAEQDSAWAAGNAEAYTAQFLPEISFTNVVGAYSIGKEPMLAQVRKIFSTIYKGSHTKTTLIHITKIGNDIAIVDTISQLTGFIHPAMTSVVIDGSTYSRLQQTMIKRDGAWWIASFHNVFIDPEFADKASLPK